MGCNFYTLNGIHIGKRSADGIWCYDCKVRAQVIDIQLYQCPQCKATEHIDKMYNAAFRELGFHDDPPEKHIGINGASSFCWQTGDRGLADTIEGVKKKLQRRRYVKDVYGKRYKVSEFFDIFKEVIGEESLDRYFS